MEHTYVLNLDEYKSVRTYQIVLYVNGNNRIATYFDRFRVENIPKEIKSSGNKNIITNICRIQA